MAQEHAEGGTADSPTAARGRLPDFLVIGAPKSGTTSLATWLRAHAEIHIPEEKEIHFFDGRWDRGVEWYRDQFSGATDTEQVGEASPTYLFHPDAPERVARTLPGVRLVALLRHPVDRAWSHYWYERRNDRDDRSFADAVDLELTTGPGAIPRESYLAQGRYADLLERWEARFGRDRLHVELFDDLESAPDRVFADVCRFLGVDASQSPTNVGKVYNANYRLRSPRLRMAMYRWRLWKRLPFRLGFLIDRLNQAPLDYPRMDPELRRRLVAEFEADNAALAEWLGRPLPEAWGR